MEKPTHFQGYRSQPLRHPGWNYASGGWYFFTICTKGAQHLFGAIENESIKLSLAGKITLESWHDIPNHHPIARLDQFVVMPNHVHGILDLDPHPSNGPKGHLGTVIGSYKAAVSRKCKKAGVEDFFWQEGYYERIVRDEKELFRIRTYIENNPVNWELEMESPENVDLG